MDFIESVIRTAREGASVDGLFYRNDIESLHAAQKRIQCFKSQDVLGAVQTMEKLIQREENDEVMAIYGSGSYVLSQDYAKWFAPVWHTWPVDRRSAHLEKFRKFIPSLDQTFRKPLNAGQNPDFYPRIRKQVLPTLVIDRLGDISSQAPTSSTAPCRFQHRRQQFHYLQFPPQHHLAFPAVVLEITLTLTMTLPAAM